MIVSSDHDESPPRGWSTVTLRGGPFDRQTVILPADADEHVAWADATLHRYFRLRSNAAVLHHERRVAAWFAGKRGGR